MHLILGFGATGASYLRYLNKRNIPALIMDSRDNPPGLSEFKSLNKENLYLGGFNQEILDKVETILVSPGIPYDNEILLEARKLNKKIVTDIEIFLIESKSRNILVTGTNGKTTAVSMITHVLKGIFQDEKIISCGNIGIPVLDTLEEENDISVIEVSSFQLEHSNPDNLECEIACLLNVSEDHLDRHVSLEEYKEIKEKVFSHCKIEIRGEEYHRRYRLNQLSRSISFWWWGWTEGTDDSATNMHLLEDIYKDHYKFPFNKHLYTVMAVVLSVTILRNKNKVDLGINFFDMSEEFLERQLDFLEKELDLSDLWLKTAKILNSFALPEHRFEYLGIRNGVHFINDSKATNIHSMLAAIDEVKNQYGKNKTILICGGDSKNQDISKITKENLKSIKKILIYGVDKKIIKENIHANADCLLVNDLEEAVDKAKSCSIEGDVVLLSPFCASTDMFLDYRERGHKFRELSGFN